MTLPRLSIAYGDELSQRTHVLSEVLRGQGHEVISHPDARAFLAAPEPDLYLLGSCIADGSSGLDLLEALRRTGRSAPVLLLGDRPDFASLRRAVELGANDLLLRPLEPGELARALERAVAERTPRPRIDATPRSHVCERTYSIDEHTVGRAAREISAFLVNEGVASAHRVRIASAVAELVDNACRHAYGQENGAISVRAEVQGARVQLSVEDDGRGFDVVRARLERVPAPLPRSRAGRTAAKGPRALGAGASPACSSFRSSLPLSSSSNGLGRVERLCEEHRIASGPGGTRVELTFELTPVRFDEESESLADTDFLDPERARSLIAALRKGQDDLSGVAPAMALTVGRILGGIDAEARSPRNR
jgi:anti-sigma regulatory factor (Ser/Thr protein kinase)/CheY-like chemotaxis protein